MSDKVRKKLVSTQRKVLRSVTRYSEKVAAYFIQNGIDVCILDFVVPGMSALSPGVKIGAERFTDDTITKADARKTVRNALIQAWKIRREVSNTVRSVFSYFPDIVAYTKQ